MTSGTIDQILSVGKPLSGKWKLELLARLSCAPARWNTLVKFFPDVAPNVLTRQLAQLERDGLIHRVVHSAKPPKVVEYRLTNMGAQYLPFLAAMDNWARTYRQDNAV